MGILKAKYGGLCPTCDHWFEKGTDIFWDATGLAVHVKCPWDSKWRVQKDEEDVILKGRLTEALVAISKRLGCIMPIAVEVYRDWKVRRECERTRFKVS